MKQLLYNRRHTHTDTKKNYSTLKSGVIAKILALFISFLQKTPEFVHSDSPNHEAEFSFDVTSIIKSHDALLYHFICGLTSNHEPQLVTCLSQLFKPFIQGMFVGHMQTSLVMFLWDNCMDRFQKGLLKVSSYNDVSTT